MLRVWSYAETRSQKYFLIWFLVVLCVGGIALQKQRLVFNPSTLDWAGVPLTSVAAHTAYALIIYTGAPLIFALAAVRVPLRYIVLAGAALTPIMSLILIAAEPGETLLFATQYMLAFAFAAFGPVLLYALYFRQFSGAQAFTGLLVLIATMWLVTEIFYVIEEIIGAPTARGDQVNIAVVLAVLSAICVLGFYRRVSDSEPDATQRPSPVATKGQLVRNIMLSTLALFCVSFPMGVVTTHLIPYAVQEGIRHAQFGSSVVGISAGIGGFLALLLYAVLAPYISRRILIATAIFGICLTIAAVPLLPMSGLLANGVAASVKIFNPVIFLLFIWLVTGFVSGKWLPICFAILSICGSLGFAVGTYIAGYVYDLYHSYDLVWWICLGVGFAGLGSLWGLNEADSETQPA